MGCAILFCLGHSICILRFSVVRCFTGDSVKLYHHPSGNLHFAFLLIKVQVSSSVLPYQKCNIFLFEISKHVLFVTTLKGLRT